MIALTTIALLCLPAALPTERHARFLDPAEVTFASAPRARDIELMSADELRAVIAQNGSGGPVAMIVVGSVLVSVGVTGAILTVLAAAFSIFWPFGVIFLAATVVGLGGGLALVISGAVLNGKRIARRTAAEYRLEHLAAPAPVPSFTFAF